MPASRNRAPYLFPEVALRLLVAVDQFEGAQERLTRHGVGPAGKDRVDGVPVEDDDAIVLFGEGTRPFQRGSRG